MFNTHCLAESPWRITQQTSFMGAALSLLQDRLGPSYANSVLFAVAAVTVRQLWLSFRVRRRQGEMAQLAKKKLRARDLARESLDLPEIKNASSITQLSAVEILSRLESGELSSVDVVTAMCRAALAAGRALDCNAEEAFKDAIAMARERDRERKEGKVRGFLHGLPISIKDTVNMKGFDSTCGCAARVFKPASSDSLLVQLLKDQGAIPFVRTNVPQMLMLPESCNAVWGAAKNPFDVSRTPGGSSGGEAALIAARGSCLGVGTDIGGSVRGPALYCGIASFKPTAFRISKKGLAVPRPRDMNGQNAVRSTAGPLARCVADLELMMRAWCENGKMSRVDPTVPCLRWDRSAYSAKGKLTFGFFTYDGHWDAAPVCERAVKETVAALRRAGHKVVPFEFDFSELVLLYVMMMGAEGGMRGFVDGLEGEKMHDIYSYLFKTANMPSFLRPVVAAVMQLMGKDRVAKLVRNCKGMDTYDFWKCIARRDAIRKRVITQWKSLGLDAIVCPGMGLTAIPHGTSNRLFQSCSYTFIWNALQFPAGVVPTTRTREGETLYTSRHNDMFTQLAKRALSGSEGLPMGVQVVALPWADELCLRAMREVESAVQWTIPMPNYETKS